MAKSRKAYYRLNSRLSIFNGACNWRRVAESNRPSRICNPEHNLFANPPLAFYYIQGGNRQWNQIRLRLTKTSSLSEQELACARPTSTSSALWFQWARLSVARVIAASQPYRIYANTPSPCFCTTANNLSAMPLGCLLPDSHF